MTKQVDAAIIGGGIAGSSLAIDLARKGWSTIVLDQKVFPRHKSCGEFMSPETGQMLAMLGLADLLRELQPAIIREAALIFEHGARVSMPLPGDAWGISRYALDLKLHEAALEAGAEIWEGCKVEGIAEIRSERSRYPLENTAYRLNVDHHGEGCTIEARVAFGAWGSRRPSRLLPVNDKNTVKGKTARRTTIGQHPDQVGVKLHYEGITGGEAVELYFCEGGYVGIAPIEKQRLNVAALLDLRTVQKWGKSVAEIIDAAASTNKALADRLEGGIPVADTSTAQAPVRITSRPEPWGTVPHIGDAAMVIPPLCGDGMSIALRSALQASSIAELYLNGSISHDAWKRKHISRLQREFGRVIKVGGLLQAASRVPILTKMAPAALRLFPPLRGWMVRATRLNETKR